MKALLVHPGTQHSFQLACQLEQHACLSRFWTGLAYVPSSLLGRCLQYTPQGFQRSLANRRLDGVPSGRLRIKPLIEWRALRQLRAGNDNQAVMVARNAAFQER